MLFKQMKFSSSSHFTRYLKNCPHFTEQGDKASSLHKEKTKQARDHPPVLPRLKARPVDEVMERLPVVEHLVAVVDDVGGGAHVPQQRQAHKGQFPVKALALPAGPCLPRLAGLRVGGLRRGGSRRRLRRRRRPAMTGGQVHRRSDGGSDGVEKAQSCLLRCQSQKAKVRSRKLGYWVGMAAFSRLGLACCCS